MRAREIWVPDLSNQAAGSNSLGPSAGHHALKQYLPESGMKPTHGPAHASARVSSRSGAKESACGAITSVCNARDVEACTAYIFQRAGS